MRAIALATACLAAASGDAAARYADPEDYVLLITRYAEACERLSPEECRFTRPMGLENAERLACLFQELENRGGPGTAEAHVRWAEAFAESGQPPATGFPSSVGEQEVLMGALIACRVTAGTEQ